MSAQALLSKQADEANSYQLTPLLLYRQKFSPGENSRQFHHLLLLAKVLSATVFLYRVNNYIEDVVTFTAWRNLFHRIFLQYKGTWTW